MPGFSAKSLQRKTLLRDILSAEELAEELAELSVQNQNHIPAQGSLTKVETHPKKFCQASFLQEKPPCWRVYSM